MLPGWNETIDKMAVEIAQILERTPVPPSAPPSPSGVNVSGLFVRWQAALDRFDTDGAALEAFIEDLIAFRDHMRTLAQRHASSAMTA